MSWNRCLHVQSPLSSRSQISNWRFGGTNSACISLSSMPITEHDGFASAMSIANMPVRVYTSRTSAPSKLTGARPHVENRDPLVERGTSSLTGQMRNQPRRRPTMSALLSLALFGMVISLEWTPGGLIVIGKASALPAVAADTLGNGYV